MSNWKSEFAQLAIERMNENFGGSKIQINNIRGEEECINYPARISYLFLSIELNSRIFVGRGKSMNDAIVDLETNILFDTKELN